MCDDNKKETKIDSNKNIIKTEQILEKFSRTVSSVDNSDIINYLDSLPTKDATPLVAEDNNTSTNNTTQEVITKTNVEENR